MGGSESGRGGPGAKPGSARTYARLLGYARPYFAIILLAVFCSLLYAGARTGRAYLLKPVLDDIMIPQAGRDAKVGFGDWLQLAGDGAGDSADADSADAIATGGAAAADADSQALSQRAAAAIPRLLLAALLIVTLLPLSRFGHEYLSQYVLGRVLVDIQQQLCGKLLRLPLAYHYGRARGQTLSRVMNDAQQAQRSLELVFADVLPSLITLGVGATALFWISWQLTLSVALVAPLVVGIVALFGRSIRRNAARRQESQGHVTQRLLQIFAGLKVIKAFRAEGHEEKAFSRENLRWLRRNMRVVLFRSLSRSSIEGATNAFGIAILIGGIAVVLSQTIVLSLGDVGAFFLVMQTATYRPIRDLTRGWTQIQEGVPSALRFFEVVDADSEARDAPDAFALNELQRDIRLVGVSFSHGSEKVLRNISLDVPAGSAVAIVGRTGAGKSTLADLLMRFADPDSGCILVDGVDLREIRRESWLSQIAIVGQEPFLFAGSIRENILYGRPEATAEELRDAARAAHVDEFASRLPQGLDSEVGDSGVRLSGGQRQRITIARAILRNPRVLIFDEATSALDAKSERYVQGAIEKLLAGRTVFIIAHRLSTIRHADQIIVLENSVIAERGSHAELLAAGGLYRQFAELQQPGRTREAAG